MIIVYKNLIPYNFNNTQCIVYCTILSSTDVSHFSVAKATLHSQMSVCLFVCQSAKPLNSLKSSSFIIHPSSIIILHSSFIILHSSFLHFATFKLFSLFLCITEWFKFFLIFQNLRDIHGLDNMKVPESNFIWAAKVLIWKEVCYWLTVNLCQSRLDCVC